MKKLNSLEFENLLSAITYGFCTNKEIHYKFSSINLGINGWPESLAKTIISEFQKAVKEKSFEFAYYQISEKYKNFEMLKFQDETFPDVKVLESLVAHNCKIFWCKKIAQELLNEPENHERIISKLNSLDFSNNQDEFTVSGHIMKTIENNEQRIKDGTALVVIPEFKLFSEAIGGFNPQRISLISAKSGFGKTKLAINLADSARKIMPVYYFNMEMSADDFEAQFLQKNGGITYKDFISGKYHDRLDRLLEYKDSFKKGYEITFTDGRSMDIEKICSRILSHFRERGGLVVVDYDGKIVSSSKQDEWLMILKSIEKLEDAAKATKSHIIVLMQADDGGDAKTSKRAKQPAASFTSFEKDDSGKYILRNIKNRFGETGFQIYMDYAADKTQIAEIRMKERIEQNQTVNILRRK